MAESACFHHAALCGDVLMSFNFIFILLSNNVLHYLNQLQNYEKKFKMAVHGNGYSCDECFVCKLR